MITKLKNCNILTNTSKNVLFGTEILVCDNKIKQIGKSASTMQTDLEIDLNGALVIPGLNNMFCFPYSLDMNFDNLVNSTEYDSSISYVKNKLEDNFNFEKFSNKLVSNGVTSSYLVDVQVFKNLSAEKLRLGYFISIDENLKDGYQVLKKEIEKLLNHSSLKPILLINHILDLNDDDISTLIEIAKNFDLTIAVRIAKTLDDSGEIDKQTGMSPISYLESLGILDRKCLLLDCTVLDKEDINILSLYENVSLALSVQSDMILGNGVAPLCAFLNKNINVVLGLDNLACSNLDMFREMYLAKNLQSVAMADSNAVSAEDIFKLATSNFEAVFEQKIGKIEEGYLADLIAIRNDRIDYNNIYDSIINLVDGNDVELTMINGEIVYKK